MFDLALKMLLDHKLKCSITVAGVAFAVTLVLVHVGLLLGLLDNATITIENHARGYLGSLRKSLPTST